MRGSRTEANLRAAFAGDSQADRRFTYFARRADIEGRPDAALQVECALFVAGTAALEICGKNIQLHGGIGFSDEADPHLFLKRAQLLVAVAGGLEAANERIANIQTGW